MEHYERYFHREALRLLEYRVKHWFYKLSRGRLQPATLRGQSGTGTSEQQDASGR